MPKPRLLNQALNEAVIACRHADALVGCTTAMSNHLGKSIAAGEADPFHLRALSEQVPLVDAIELQGILVQVRNSTRVLRDRSRNRDNQARASNADRAD